MPLLCWCRIRASCCWIVVTSMAWQQDDHVAVAGWISSCSPTLTWSTASLRRFTLGVSGAHAGVVASMELFWVLEWLCGQPNLLASLLGFVARMGLSHVCTFHFHPPPHFSTVNCYKFRKYKHWIHCGSKVHICSAFLVNIATLPCFCSWKKRVNVLTSNACLMIEFSA